MTIRFKSNGHANLFVAPKAAGPGAVPVLRFTTTVGTTFELALNLDEVRQLHTAASRLVNADERAIESWLDDAASQLHANFLRGLS